MSHKADTEKYTLALEGKDIPILTLDAKWKLLFGDDGLPPKVSETAKELDDLLEKQSALREKVKEVKKLKKKLLGDIMPLRQRAMSEPGGQAEALLDKHTSLVAECNEKIEQMEDEQIGLPREISQVNYRLMLMTMAHCYEYMHANTEQISVINNWITDVRAELKKQLINKQESELDNYNIYTYMHQIFGPEVIEIFDMKYDPEKWHLRIAGEGETG